MATGRNDLFRAALLLAALALFPSAAAGQEPSVPLILTALGDVASRDVAVVAADSLPEDSPLLTKARQAAMDGKVMMVMDDNGSRGVVPLDMAEGPVLEFRQLSPVRWLVRAHGVNTGFPFYFGEGFHPGWKLYLRPIPRQPPSEETLERYAIIPGNETTQATRDEVRDYVRKGWVSALGGARRAGYVSRSSHRVVQNENLQGGPPGDWDVQVDPALHAMANGQANLWWIPLDAVQRAVHPESGEESLHVEMVLEFEPQRTYEAMQWLSASTATLLALVLIAGLVRRR